MGFLGFKTDAEKKAENDAIRARARAKAEAATAPEQPAAPTPPTPPAPAPASTPAPAPDLLKTGAGAIPKPRVPDELKNYKKGGVIKCATGGVISSGEKKLLKQKAMVKQKRGC